MVFTAAFIAALSVAFPRVKAWVLRTCDRIDERVARRRGEWDAVAGKRIPYWDRDRRPLRK
jgi:hypothetical protein